MNWYLDHISPSWDNSFKKLNYEYLPQRDQDIVDVWVKNGYSNMNLNGAIVIRKNTIPSWAVDIINKLGWENTGVNMYKMSTGDVLPAHADHYKTYKKTFKIKDPMVIWRCLVFMEDWKSGHYFEVDGEPIIKWKAGDYAVWNYDVPHMAANIGIDPRYTMQITGMVL